MRWGQEQIKPVTAHGSRDLLRKTMATQEHGHAGASILVPDTL
jgi:hypothetical protein